MEHQRVTFSQSATDIYFDADFEQLKALAPTHNSFIITDENVMMHYQDLFKPWKCIVVPPGESSKSLAILDDIIRQLIALDAGRDATIIGIGGGVVTDIAGFVAGIYKRGVKCGFVPTTILGMVDAAIGGKNGLDIGEYKNMMGLIRQPSFLLYHYPLLDSLPEEEWVNGFAEIIKHACIKGAKLFESLQENSLAFYQKNEAALANLIKANVDIKLSYVREDEWEQGIRKELNFGHTLAHAVENIYSLPHGHAVAIGMAFAARLSEEQSGFTRATAVVDLLQKYQLPTTLDYDAARVAQIMWADKKRNGNTISYVLLDEIGKACVKELSMDVIKQQL